MKSTTLIFATALSFAAMPSVLAADAPSESIGQQILDELKTLDAHVVASQHQQVIYFDVNPEFAVGEKTPGSRGKVLCAQLGGTFVQFVGQHSVNAFDIPPPGYGLLTAKVGCRF